MRTADDLMRQANTLAEKIRTQRARVRTHSNVDAGEIAAMEARLRELWVAIRAARVAGPADAPPSGRRTYPKWR